MIDLHESRRVGGRVHAVVMRRRGKQLGFSYSQCLLEGLQRTV
jgi:cytochrome c2